MTEKSEGKKGAVLQAIGCVLLFLGLLNTLLSVKGGFETNYLNPVFMLTGALALIAGIHRSAKS